MSIRRLTIILAIMIGWGCFLLTGQAAEQRAYKKGDKVQVKYVGEIVAGTITSTKIAGSIEVEFDWKGKKTSKSFPLNLVVTDNDGSTPATETPPVPAPAKTNGKKPVPAKAAPKKSSPPPGKAPQGTASQTGEFRTWTSATGKFSIKARFDGIRDGTVTLTQEDGTSAGIALEKLSEEDQEFVKGLEPGTSDDTEMTAEESPEEGPPSQPIAKNTSPSPKSPGGASPKPGNSPKKPTAKAATGKPKPAQDDTISEEELEGQELRTWTSDDGKETIEARFAGMVGDTVQLVGTDGKPKRMSLFKLSVEDRLVAQNLHNERNMAQLAKAKAPRQPGEPLTASTDLVISGQSSWSVGSVTPASPDPAADFTLEPDVAVIKPLTVLDRPYVFASESPSPKSGQVGKGFFDAPGGLFLDPIKNEAIIIIYGKNQALAPVIQVVRIQLQDGAITSSIFPSPVEITDYDPTTEQLTGFVSFHLSAGLTSGQAPPRSAAGQDASGGFDLSGGSSAAATLANQFPGGMFGFWKQGADEIEPEGAWPLSVAEVFGNATASNREPEYQRFAGGKYVVIWNTASPLRVWDVARRSPHFAYQSAFISSPPALSPNAKYLGIQGEDRLVHIIEMESGKVVGKLPVTGLDAVAFDPQGRHIAAASRDRRIVIYDTQAGKLTHDFMLPGTTATLGIISELQWLDDGRLLANKTAVIDPELQVVLWIYDQPMHSHHQPLSILYNGEMWYVLESRDGKQLGLFHSPFPHAAVQLAAQSFDPNDTIVNVGSKIRIEVSGEIPAEEQPKIRQSLKEKIEANQMIVDDASSLVLKASSETGETVQQTYTFSNRDSQTVTSTPIYGSVVLVEQGTPAWSESTTIGGGAPGAVFLKPGESAQDKVNANAKPRYDFFYNVQLPKRLVRVPAAGAYGFSKFTPTGIEPVNSVSPR